MVIGAYYLTFHPQGDLSKAKPEDFDEMPPAFASYDEVIQAYEQRLLDQRQVHGAALGGRRRVTRKTIRLRLADGSRVITTVGRAIFNMEVENGLRELLEGDFDPASYTFSTTTSPKRPWRAFINELVASYGATKVARLLDILQGGRVPLRHPRRR